MNEPINNTVTVPENGKSWPIHSSQAGLAKELMESGITVGLNYIITLAEHPNKESDNG